MIALKFLNIALVAIYAIGSGLWVSTGDSWYRQLKTPFWQPPDLVFGLIWPYNFTILAIVGWLAFGKLGKRWAITWLISFAISIIFALAWANLFYIKHNLAAASIALGLAALFTLPLLVIAFKASWKYGALLLPYQIWVIIATSLSIGYYKLN